MFTARNLTASEQSRNSPNFVELGGSAVQQPTTSPSLSRAIPALTAVFVKIHFVWDVWLCRWLIVISCAGYPVT